MSTAELQVGGYEVLWRMPDHTLLADLEEGLGNLGLKKYTPQPRTDLVCLRAVLPDVYVPPDKSTKYVLRPLKNGVTGYAVTRERPKDHAYVDETWSTVVATAGFDKEGELVLDPPDYSKREEIERRIADEKLWLTSGDVGKALITLLEYLDCVALRPGGGAYFVHKRHYTELSNIVKVFEEARSREPKDPAKHGIAVLSLVANEQMVWACGAALTEEVELALAAIEKEIESGALSEAACTNRVKKAGELQAKVKRYAAAFGHPMERLTQAIEEVSTTAALAALQASAVDQKPISVGV